MDKILTYIKIYLKTLGLFCLTAAVVTSMIYAGIKIHYSWRQNLAITQIAEKQLKLPVIEQPISDYIFTAQTWAIPDYRLLLNAMSWLNDYENCIFSTRLNEMKFAGMVPKNYTIADFEKHFTKKELYEKFGLHVWDKNLDSKILSDINNRLNKDSKYRYRFVHVASMDELIYLAKRKQHVLVGVTIWQAPNKKRKEPTRYRNAPISHAMTITGIKSYDPAEDLIEFEINDPLPFTFINNIRVFNKHNPKGYNLFGRHAVPYLVKTGRAKSGYVVRELKTRSIDENQISLKDKPENDAENERSN